MISTTSPTAQPLCSSWALYLTRRVTNLWNRRSRMRRITLTTTVLSMAFEVTVPVMVRRVPRVSVDSEASVALTT
jgi:hypothetical protein